MNLDDHAGPVGDMSCAVCGRVLDWVTTTQGTNGAWAHSTQDQKGEDHPAVPVSQDSIHTIYRCDFCNLDTPTHEVPASDFELVAGGISVGPWKACGVCAALITASEWEKLVDRAITVSPTIRAAIRSGDLQRETIRPIVKVMYGQLCKHMTGLPTELLPSKRT